MSLFRRGKYWQYDFWFEGIRYQKSTKQRDKREAEKIENAVKTDLARRKYNLPSKSLRFSELCVKYAEFATTNAKPAYVTEKYHIASHLVPHFGEIFVHAINLDICEKYKRDRLKAGAQEPTINREFSTLKGILKYGSNCGLAPEGLGKNAVMFPRVTYKQKQVLTPAGFDRLSAVCASLEFAVTAPHLFPLVVVGYWEGLRPSEFTSLAKDDIDFQTKGGIIWVGRSKTRSGIRYVPIKKEVLEVLRNWMQKTKSGWLFPSPRKAGDHIKDFGKAFGKACNKAGLSGITPDCLRHTFATRVKRKVRRLSDLREMMGHADDRHTEPYLHEELEDKRAAIEALHVPANFTTSVNQWCSGLEASREQMQVPQELVMVGPWGLEPQTSTVSR